MRERTSLYFDSEKMTIIIHQFTNWKTTNLRMYFWEFKENPFLVIPARISVTICIWATVQGIIASKLRFVSNKHNISPIKPRDLRTVIFLIIAELPARAFPSSTLSPKIVKDIFELELTATIQRVSRAITQVHVIVVLWRTLKLNYERRAHFAHIKWSRTKDVVLLSPNDQ